jgi:hypothetical protein
MRELCTWNRLINLSSVEPVGYKNLIQIGSLDKMKPEVLSQFTRRTVACSQRETRTLCGGTSSNTFPQLCMLSNCCYRTTNSRRFCCHLFRGARLALDHCCSYVGIVLSKAMISSPIPLIAAIIRLDVVTLWHAITSLRPGRSWRSASSFPIALCARAVDRAYSTS